MTAQRWIGFALVALQVALMGYIFHDYAVPLVAGAVALLGMLRPLRLRWSLERRVLYGLLLAVAMAAKWRLMPTVARDNLIMDQGLGVGLAQFLLLLQAALFHLEFPAQKHPLALPKTLPAYAVAALACAGDVTARGLEITAYQISAFAFLFLSVLYIAVSDGHGLFLRRFPARAAIGALLLLVVGGLAWSSSWFMGTNRAKLDEIFLSPFAASFAPAQSVGFSGSASLNSITHVKTEGEDKAALRVFAAAEPGYLRGRAFIVFDGREWTPDPAQREVEADAPLPAEPPRPHEWPAKAFRLEDGKGPWNVYETWPAKEFPVAFTPLGASILAAPADVLHVSDSGLAEGRRLGQYAAYVPQERAAPGELSRISRDLYTSLSGKVDPRIIALAAEVFRGCNTVTDKIAAVENYFHTQYQYELGIQIPPDEDPITYFLLEKPPAHCEYFASGATVLLRLGGVPCRYVTGFVASERNAYGGYWVARNRDAHAWAEAYDDATGWRIVEATPSSGVPKQRPATNERWDNLRFRLRELMAMGWREMLRSLLVTALRYLILPTAVVGGIVALLWTLWRRLRLHGLAILKRKRPNDPLLILLIKMDAAVAEKGHRRAPAETLHHFAARLSQSEDDTLKPASNWYRAYAETRYGYPNDPAAHARLQASAEALKTK